MNTFLSKLKNLTTNVFSLYSNAGVTRLIDYAISLEKQNKILLDQHKFKENMKAMVSGREEPYPEVEMEVVPLSLEMYCPKCGEQHVDEGEWSTREHKTHQCQSCMHEWKPFLVPSFGIK